ncbi:creatininase family protein [Stigmatella sp. ncwal1]|uniref:Creatininase family protein n=1 Tax=Stigmatella ashevillensis TaxID=2995309 RepID=A0ABT5DM78_9BACT|nr:creatininase family protein [Stigmatella ashevillena]MDC0714777.1 creatininase family protein [Stigmatella ashevillena]
MPETESGPSPWRTGYEVLQERVQRLPALLRAQAKIPVAPVCFDPRSVRCFLTSGVGSSEAHARYLAALLSGEMGLPARFVPLSALAFAPPRTAERDVLIVFSQGLSPNARLPLATPKAWQHVVLATAVTDAGAARPGQEAKRELLDRLSEAGGQVVRFLPEDEYTTLVRVLGPMAGYLCALRMAQAIGERAGIAPIAVDLEALCARIDQAGPAVDAAFAGWDLSTLPGELAFLTSGEYGELTANLRYKVLEGMLAPLPPVWDLLHFAHGPFQQSHDHRAVFIALTHEGAPRETGLLSRLETMLVPERHALVRWEAHLPGPLAIFEHEALLNHLMLRVIEARRIDQVRWPGQGLDGPIYEVGAEAPGMSPLGAGESPKKKKPEERRLDRLTWPELERLLARGVRTAVLPLGALEQHGFHLPFATDTWIADALAERFCARVEDAIACPALSFGCSPEHLAFPGTLSLSAATLSAVLQDLLVSCRQHGFERAYLFSGHGGNGGPLAECIRALRAASAPMELIVFTDLDRLTRIFHGASQEHGVGPECSGHHAGEFETSILRGLRPEAVRLDRLEPGFMKPAEQPSALFYPSLRANAPNGTVGDPRPSAPERAERYLEAWVDVLVHAYREALARKG